MNTRDAQGRTSLHEAASLLGEAIDAGIAAATGSHGTRMPTNANGRDVAALLICAGSDVDARDEDDNTPLSSAVTLLQPDVAALLLDNGADPAAQNKQGISPLAQVRSLEQGGGLAHLNLYSPISAHMVVGVFRDRGLV